ncbi:MAG: agmatine deiminase family protein [Pseudomonadota bacterium]
MLTSVEDRSAFVPDYASVGANVVAGTPQGNGFRMPAEWTPHERTVMIFPARHNTYEGNGRDNWYEAACDNWSKVALAVAAFEPVLMIAHTGEADIARHWCGDAVDIVEMPMNDPWSRDNGPSILCNDKGERCAAGYVFNGWGDGHDECPEDGLIKGRIAHHLDLSIYPSPLVLEGGAITVDGEGTLITTEHCVMNRNRNPTMTKAEVEAEMGRQLGIEKVIWLPNGLVPDPITDGHVDGICAFIAPGAVMVHTIDDRDDPNHEICNAARRVLESATDAKGRGFDIVEIPLAGEVAHMNYFIANDGVVVPTCGDAKADDRALGIIREAFPGRKIVGIEAITIAEGGGGVHCITQQVPQAGA